MTAPGIPGTLEHPDGSRKPIRLLAEAPASAGSIRLQVCDEHGTPGAVTLDYGDVIHTEPRTVDYGHLGEHTMIVPPVQVTQNTVPGDIYVITVSVQRDDDLPSWMEVSVS